MELDVNIPIGSSQGARVELEMMLHFSGAFDKLDVSNLSRAASIDWEESDEVLLV